MSADDSGDELDLQERFARAEQLQRAAAELQVQPERSPEEIKQEQMELFATERIRLLSDHGYIALVLTSLVWLECPLKTTASFALGTFAGGVYLYLLGRYVESIGAQTIEEAAKGGAGQARFAIVILLVLIAGKQREYLEFIPLISGFLVYQLTALFQALPKEEREEKAPPLA